MNTKALFLFGLMSCFLFFGGTAFGQIRPNNAPTKSPAATDAIYTQETGQLRKVLFGDAKQYFSRDEDTLFLASNILSISGGNSVNLSAYLDNTDNQTMSLSSNVLTLIRGNSVNLSAYLDNTDNQTLSLSSNVLAITGGNAVNLSAYLDNTDNQALSLSSNILSISGGNSINLSTYLDNTDNQTLSLSSNILSITGGNTVNLSAFLDNTDNQALSLSSNVLSISGGNSVSIPYPAGVNNSIQAYNGASSFKADTTVKLGSYAQNSRNPTGIKLGKYLGVTTLLQPNPALIIAPKFKINGGVPNIVFESPSGDSESWPFAFGQFSDNNINRHPSIGSPNRPVDTTFNNVVMWGFNPGNLFGSPSRNKPSAWYAMEPNWYNGGQKWLEPFHMSVDWGEGEVRIFTTELQDVKNPIGPFNVLNWRGDSYQYSTLKGNKLYIAGGGSTNGTATLGVFAGRISAQFFLDSLNNFAILRNYYPTAGSVFRVQGYDRMAFGQDSHPNTFTLDFTNGYGYIKGLTSTTGGNLIQIGQGFNVMRSGGWPLGTTYTEGGNIFASSLVDGGTGGWETFISGSGGYYYRWKMGTDVVFRISSNRNVGVGEDAPNAKLHVTGDCIITSTLWLNSTKTIGIFTGTGSPEGVVTASVSSCFHRTNGGAGTSFYVKETGSGSTGWVAK